MSMHRGLTDHEKRLFQEMGLDLDNRKLLLSTVLASPQAFANNLGVGRTTHLTAWLCSQLAQEELAEFLKEVEEQPVVCTGAILGGSHAGTVTQKG